MSGRAGENGARLILVCVDQCGDGDFSGRLYHPDWQDGQGFCSAVQLLLQIEALLGQEKMQQSFGAKRTFSVPAPGQMGQRDGAFLSLLNIEKARSGTFQTVL